MARTDGPLLTAWSVAASSAALERTLLPPGRALPAPVAGVDDGTWATADAVTVVAARQRAQAERDTPWPQPLASQYARYFRDGDRSTYENEVGSRQERLTRAVLLAATAQPDSADRMTWLDEAADGIVLMCEQSSWCWAAHEDTCPAHGTVLPDVSAPCLDLGAGEVAAQLAWADHVLGPLFDDRVPGLRNRLRHEVSHRAFGPFLDRQDWHWLGLDGNVHNWCPWICGNLLTAALQLAPPGPRRATLVRHAIEGIDRYLASLPPDGSIDEGYEYWWNGACRALEALSVLEYATEGALDASEVAVVRETVRFPHRMQLGGDWYLNLADAQARPSHERPWHVVYHWAHRTGDKDAARHAASYRAADRPATAAHDGLGRMLTALADPAWLSATPTTPPLVEYAWLPGTEVGLARETGGTPSGLALAVKGGHNGEHHNHNDVGSVVIAIDGVPVIVDAGRPTYTAQTFGPDRYAIWSMQSDWHNVPEINGTAQHPGREYHAREMTFADDGERCRIRLELSAAYAAPTLQEWWRTAILDRPARHVTVTDAWAFAGSTPQAPTTVHYLLAGTVESTEPGRVVVRPVDGDRACVLTWDPRQASGTLTERILDDPMHSGVWGSRLTRLGLNVPDDARGQLTLTVEVLT